MNLRDTMLEREQIANRRKHWVRAVTACNSRCVFCLDMDTPRNVFLPIEEVQAELQRGREELDADKVIISGGEASLHPSFHELVRYGRSIGYDRVQTVTNGWNFAERDFYREAMAAGLGEITFSLHGHTAELHDRLTRHHGSFARLMKGMIRAIRDPRGPIVNVDVVINKQNVGVLDRIIELCISVGVTEFDLLHVIPQSEAYRNREDLFYDVRDHMDVLHRVFRLNRHPRLVIWTNRFPISYLEGLEDLIQDPHKMLDEVNGRRFQVRRYLDTGEPLDCRQQERCVHCFIEPFCTTMDRVITTQHAGGFEVWQGETQGEDAGELPFGCTRWGQTAASWDDVQWPDVGGLELTGMAAEPIPRALPVPVRMIADHPDQLTAWLSGPLPALVEVEVVLNQVTAPWLMKHRETLLPLLDSLRIHQPSHTKLAGAMKQDVRNPGGFFTRLALPIRVSGLPACLTTGAVVVSPVARLSPALFDPELGRLDSRALSEHHIEQNYRAKSERCRDCAVTNACDGIHVNMIRDQGLALARPLAQAPAVHPPIGVRIAEGCPPLPPAESLPGFAPPQAPPRDPLSVMAEQIDARREAKRVARKKMLADARES
ncbi:MAG: MoaA/NifB/PqqE/SkfB family radical SAM enzyme [Myxococcota bacterium]|jgi:MoaA/NifB/PqqE/SkfB family radical SAM enzyme